MQMYLTRAQQNGAQSALHPFILSLIIWPSIWGVGIRKSWKVVACFIWAYLCLFIIHCCLVTRLSPTVWLKLKIEIFQLMAWRLRALLVVAPKWQQWAISISNRKHFYAFAHSPRYDDNYHFRNLILQVAETDIDNTQQAPVELVAMVTCNTESEWLYNTQSTLKMSQPTDQRTQIIID